MRAFHPHGNAVLPCFQGILGHHNVGCCSSVRENNVSVCMFQVIDYVGGTQISKRHILKRWRENARDILAQHLAHFQRDQAVNQSFICRSSTLYLDAMHGAG
ncbi:hypothetical protein VPH35_079995 [Triticum aestivum]|uniref:Protein FAR1-RELATED SEQUENCE n=1 Tax=Aegilops tauschii subsp. strangulata TaxID=200361 RepID=A0A453J4B9_AEGTS